MPVAPQPSHGYFYPRSPCGERLTILLITVTTLLFLSTLSLRRATTSGATYLIFLAFLSTLSLRRATEQQLWQNINTYISIHALLAESDISQLQCIHGRKHFYPRSPCGERLFRQNYECFEWIISIHALLAESDGWSLNINGAMKISIHALLAESDRFGGWLIPHNRNFYPRSPCGERPIVYNIVFVPGKFLSTLSLRRATVGASQGANIEHISIHALLAESDSYNLKIHQKQENFYPRSPCGERRQ